VCQLGGPTVASVHAAAARRVRCGVVLHWGEGEEGSVADVRAPHARERKEKGRGTG
jgi:hypothetical protein